ncbi:MAG: mannose-1-phosphate guanylyltransferase [Paludibacteraceae bacterium]|nr:mannose-1-phosphate guanylyltransferase [Paludibacteraceae bacterium]
MKENNYCVIMAGGVGSRFWPFSRNSRPKQFLDFFGTGKSLLQVTVDRFRPLVPIENVLIVTNVIYRDLILEQIPDLKPDQILCEPARRNTAPCIAYSVAHIKGRVLAKMKTANASIDWESDAMNANIIVAPSDHLILDEQEFLHVVEQGFDFIEKNDVLLTLGMKPTRPETGYGYIQVKTAQGETMENNNVYPVKTFTEKPNLDLAKVFLESGEFLWNSGIFMWNLRTIRRAFRDYLPEIADKFLPGEPVMGTADEEAFIQEMFPSCPNVSIDYGIMEKAKDVRVIPASFGWSDLGTWGALYELSEKDANQNVTIHCDSAFYESKGNIVTLPKGKLAVIQGLENMIVAENDDVLLICQKASEQQIRQFVNDASVQFNGKYN